MSGTLKESLEGAGIGLLGGLVIGIYDSDWLRLAIVFALFAYAGKGLLGTKTSAFSDSYKVTFTGIASFLAVMIGLYINGQQLFMESPKETINKWVNAGYSAEQARELYLKEMDSEFRKK